MILILICLILQVFEKNATYVCNVLVVFGHFMILLTRNISRKSLLKTISNHTKTIQNDMKTHDQPHSQTLCYQINDGGHDDDGHDRPHGPIGPMGPLGPNEPN